MQIVIVQQSPICNKREFLIELKIIERFKQESVATDLIKNIYFIFLVLNMKLTQVNRMLRRKIHGKVLVFFLLLCCYFCNIFVIHKKYFFFSLKCNSKTSGDKYFLGHFQVFIVAFVSNSAVIII